MKFLELLENMNESEIDKFMTRYMGMDQEETISMDLKEKTEEVYEFMQDNTDDIMAIYDAYIDENSTGLQDDLDDGLDLLVIYEWKEDQDDENIMFPNGRDDE